MINGIFIQDQNYSKDDSTYLRDTTREYAKRFGKAITVLDSPFKWVDGCLDGSGKYAQFHRYGEAVIRNRLMQSVRHAVFISGAMDEVVYGESYEDTDSRLREFERLAGARATNNGLVTVGFLPLFCVYAEGIYPCAVALEHRRASVGVGANWRHRLFRFPMRVRRNTEGGEIHDTTYQAFIGEKWVRMTPHSMLGCREETKNHPHYFPIDLRLLHYHSLIRPSLKSTDFRVPPRSSFKDIEQHPRHYLEELLKH